MNKKIYKGHLINKLLGQNFLTDQFIIDSMIAAFNLKFDQIVIEIGPGLGALTLPACKQLKNITVIELDHNLATRLVKRHELIPKLTLIENDVMMIDFNTIAKEKGQSLRLFGNLPYNISIPLIFRLFSFINSIIDMNFMLQKEVANRLVAKPNTKSYGRLSVMAQYFCQITPILTAPSSAFTPIPKVDSTVVHFIPHQLNPYSICNVKLLYHITTKAFSQRRKIISNSLSDLFNKQDFIQLDIDSNCRAENISVENYCRLSCKLLTKITN